MNRIKALIKSLISFLQARRLNSAIRSGKLNEQLLILMYHRVLPKSDPRLENEEPGMYVTPETFEMHLSELKNFAKLIHIEEWEDLAKQGNLEDKLYCAITFDDGWADNYEFAFPILKKHQAPATVFLATDYIDSNTTFWPERLASLINNSTDNEANLKTFFEELGEEINLNKLASMGVQEKRDYVSHLIQVAKALTEEEIKTWLDQVEKPSEAQKREMLTWNEIKKMTDAGVRIGGHTRSHLRLNDKATEEQVRDEVDGCSRDIEQQLKVRPTQFCYPNGDVSSLAQDHVGRNFEIAVTTQRGINNASSNPLTLKRVGVHEDASSTASKFKSVLARAI